MRDRSGSDPPSHVRVLINTVPALYDQKKGIGYYVQRLYEELGTREEIELLPTIPPGRQRALGAFSALSGRLRGLLGKPYERIARGLGEALLTSAWKAPRNVDVYHETSLDPGGADYDCPLVANIYDLSFLRIPGLLPHEVVRRAEQGLRKTAGADRLIVNSRFVAGEVQELLGVDAERIDVIPLAPSHPSSGARVVGGETSGSLREPYILFVGTVEPRKGLVTLIEAFEKIGRRFPDYRLLIGGARGWMYDRILMRPRQLGIESRVRFLGYVDEAALAALYARAAVFVYPSIYEGFGIPPLEAMSFGVPVVVSDIPPLVEVVGDAGRRFPPGDSDSLARVLGELLDSDAQRAELAAAGPVRARTFSWRRAATETVESYRKAAGRS